MSEGDNLQSGEKVTKRGTVPASLANLTGGSRKGIPNKTTVAVKSALLAAYEGIGGDQALIEWGKDNQTEFYKLWVKILPTEIVGESGGPVRFILTSEDEAL